MAKKCTNCKRSYPEHLPACPYCEPARAKPPTEHDLLVDDIEIVADESARPPSGKRRPAPPPLPVEEVPLAVEEVIDAGDVVEIAGTGDSSKIQLEPPIDLVDVPSDVLAVDEVETVGSSKIKLDQPAEVVEVPSDILVVGEAEAADSSKVKLDQPIDVTNVPSDVLIVEAGDSSKVKLDQPIDVTNLPSDVLVVEEAAGSSKMKLDKPVDVAAVPSDVLTVDQAEVVEEATVEPEPPTPPAPGAQPTRLGTRAPAPTMLAAREASPTMLAGQEAAAELGGAAPAPPAEPTADEPAQKRGAATHLAGRGPAPTMLAASDIADELPGSELGGPVAPRDLPNLQLDSGKGEAADDEAVEVIADDAEVVGEDALADDVLDVVEASDVRTEPPIEVVEEVEEVSAADATVEYEPIEEAPSAAGKGKGSADEASAMDLLGDDVLVEGASEVELGRKPGSKGDRPSGVDLIAEALESGVDLPGGGPRTPPQPTRTHKRTRSEEGSGSDIDLDSVLEDSAHEEAPESSAVDLGAPDGGKGRRKGAGAAPSDIAADALLDAPSGEVVGEAAEVMDDEVIGEAAEVVDDDLVMPQKARAGEDEEVVGEAAEVVDEEALVTPKAKTAAKARARAKADEEDEERPRRRRERAGGGFLRFVATLLLGVLLAGGGFAAVWFFAPQLLEGIPESPKQKGVKWQAGHDRKKEATPAQRAAAELARGDYDAAIQGTLNANDPAAQSVRGEARWQKYLKEQRAKNAPLIAGAPAVELALADFRAANEEARIKDVQQTLANDSKLRANITELQRLDTVIRATMARVRPALAKPDLKAIARTMERLAEADETLKGVGKVLAEAKLIKGKTIDPAALRVSLGDLIAARKILAATASRLMNVDVADVPKAVAALAAARKSLGEQLNVVNDQLRAAGVKGAGGKGVQELAAERNAVQEQKKNLDTVIGEALTELKKGNLVPAGADPKKQLVAGVRAARLKAESPLAASMGQMFSSFSGLGSGAGQLLQLGMDNVTGKAELAAARIRQLLSETPDQRLDTSIALFQGGGRRKDKQDVSSASKYLDWVNSKGAGLNPETRAKALFALGLAQRNNGQFADAAKTLQQAVAASAGIKGPPAWVNSARLALKELTDPTAYYLPQARRLRDQGRLQEALEELETGLGAMPNDARLHAQRGLVRLELAQSAGKVDDKTQLLVQQDAAAARKDPRYAAQGFYLLGRLDEQIGQWGKAEQDYRSALKAHPGNDEEASVYRAALARVLLRERPVSEEEPPAPKGKDKGAQTGRLQHQDAEEAVTADPRLALVALALTGVQVPGVGDEDEDPAQKLRLKQATELATELLKSSNPKTKGEGYMILGQVYARQGKRSEGILLYVKGLELYYPGRESKELAKLVNEHPAFQQPDTMARYNPLLAERYFGQGLEAFWQRRYPEAEKAFKQAVANYDQDARYQYYLGLSRYQQGGKAKREAARYDFGQGARLEAANRPNATEVNASLERLQGPLRQTLDRYRQKAGAAE